VKKNGSNLPNRLLPLILVFYILLKRKLNNFKNKKGDILK